MGMTRPRSCCPQWRQREHSNETTRDSGYGTKAKVAKAKKKPKFSSRQERRCQLCGRPSAVYRKFTVCRICFRNLALDGLIPGVKKASW